MLRFFILYFFTFYCLTTQGQKNIFGEYIESGSRFFKIEFKPDYTYTSIFYTSGCLGNFNKKCDTGKYIITNDSIKVISNKQNINEYINFYKIVWLDTNLNYIKQYFVREKPSILDTFYNTLIKQTFYNNDTLEMRVTSIDEKKLIKTYYYPSGQIRRIENYKKRKKKGSWYYFDINGKLEKMENY